MERDSSDSMDITREIVIVPAKFGKRPCSHMSNGLNLLYPRKDVAEMVIVFCVSPIVPEGLVLVEMK